MRARSLVVPVAVLLPAVLLGLRLNRAIAEVREGASASGGSSTPGSVLLAEVAPAGRLGGVKEPPADAVNTLDRLCQERFETIDLKKFGISRIPTALQHDDYGALQLQSRAERSAVADLETRGWDVIVMVAGQSAAAQARAVERAAVACNAPASVPPSALAPARAAPAQATPITAVHQTRPVFVLQLQTISSPKVLTAPEPSAPFPDENKLLSQVGSAFTAIQSRRRSSYEFRTGKWYLVARAIPAGRAACLKCHQQTLDKQPLRVGDMVGLVIYGYALSTR